MAPVNIFEQHRQLCARQVHTATVSQGLDEAFKLQALGVQIHPVAVSPQKFHQISKVAMEDKDMALERIMLQCGLNERG